MDDLISRRKVLDTLNCAYSAWCTDDVRKAIEKISIAVDDLPSVQVERKTGEWIPKDDGRYHCSSCDGIAPKGYRWSYCPNCGSKMEDKH